MRNEHDGQRLRRYVLGAASEEECEAIEREYFAVADALDRVSSAEDDLIEDYLSERLDREERERFERQYLSTPGHRRRVAVARALRTAASMVQPAAPRRPATAWWSIAGIAAALVILASGAMWMTRSQSGSPQVLVEGGGERAAPSASAVGENADRRVPAAQEPRSSGPAAPPAEPVIVAVSISPILVRGAAEPALLTMAPGVDVVRLHLEGQSGERRLGRGRAIVRTVGGREVWRGSAVAVTQPRNKLARVDIPAALLQPDDYLVELLGAGAGGREVERYRYFLRVRVP